MPAVAEVTFKASGQQAVEGAFRSVGSAAGDTTSKIQQNSSAMKQLGGGMKSSVSSIGQVAGAFATLSLSVVNTWRAYRDLSDAQIAVDKANLKVKKTTEAIRKTTDEIAAIKKEEGKGSLQSIATTNKIRLAEENLNKHRKDGKHTAAQLRVEQDNINLAMQAGAGSSKKLTDAQNKLTLLQESLGVQTDVATEAQERFNDAQQNFYLSILPTALSGFASLSMAMSGIKGALTGGGGLVAGFGPLALILGGLSLAVIAFQTNFLGMRDAIGGVITWLKDRFGVWKQAIEDVFSFIKAGDWNGAFKRIQQSAAAFWEDLKKTVPFFGEVAKLVENIQKGNWKGAFLQIWKAASDAWNTIKKNVPILGKIEDFLKGISAGDWKGTFTKIAQAILTAFNTTLGKGIEWMFGKNWKAGLDAKIAEIKSEASIKGIPVPIEIALEINATIAKITGIDIMKWFKDHPLTAATISLPLGGITMSIEDPNFQAGLKKGSEIIMNALGAALSTGAKILDPYIAKAVQALNWNTAITSAQDAISNAGQAIWDWIFKGIQGGFGNQDWTKLFSDFGKSVNDWWAKNALETRDAAIKNFQGSVGAKLLGAAGIEFKVTPRVDPKTPEIINKAVNPGRGQYKVPILSDTSKMPPVLKKQLTGVVNSQHPQVKIDANLAAANAKWQAFVRKVQMTKLQVSIAGGSSNIKKGSQAGAYGGPHAAGWNTTVKRPTMFMAGEGGRQEDVYIKPKGSAGQGPSGGGFNGTINVYVDGVLRPARYDMGARK